MQYPVKQAAIRDGVGAEARFRVGWYQWEWVALAMIVVGAFVLRAWTVRRGLPFIDNVDEPNPITYAIEMMRTGDLNPHVFRKPTLYVYLLLVVLSLHYRWGFATGSYPALDQMAITTHVHTTVPEFFIWGRMLTVVVGSLTVLGVFMLAKREWSRPAGLIAALFIALSPFHMRSSQYVTFDVPSAALVLATFLVALGLMEHGRWRAYLLAGLCVGFAASTKYNAGVAATIVAAAHGLYWRRESLRRLMRLIAAGVMAVVGFLIGTPYALLAWPEFVAGLTEQQNDYNAAAHGDFVGRWPILGYAKFLWFGGIGPVATVALILGIVLLMQHRRKTGLLWFSFALPYLLAMLAQASHFNRNLMPLIVLCALPVGVGGAAVIAWLAERAPRLRPVVAAGVLVALLMPGTVQALQYSQRLQRGDTRVQVSHWIEENVPPGVRVAAEIKPVPGAGESRWAEVEYLPMRDLAWYRQQGYQYVIASSDTWRSWNIPEEYTTFVGRSPIAEFGGTQPQDMLGPRLVIYETGLSASDLTDRPQGVVQFGGSRLLGATLGMPDSKLPLIGTQPARAFKPGDVLALRTFWQIEQPFNEDYFIFVHVVDAVGNKIAQRDTPPWQGRFPTTSWRPDTIVVDVNDVALPPTVPPGEYRVVVGMFDPATGRQPPITVDGQAGSGEPVTLATIQVVP